MSAHKNIGHSSSTIHWAKPKLRMRIDFGRFTLWLVDQAWLCSCAAKWPMFDELDRALRRRRSTKSSEYGREYTGRISSYKQQQRAFRRAEMLQDSLDPENPSFVKTMVRSHVSSCFWLGLPSRFCKDHLPPREVKMVLEDEEGVEFDAVYIGNRTGLSGGWRGFSMEHNLEDGDSLVFELVEPDRFKIHIIKAIDEDVNEAEPDDKNADPSEEEPDQDSPNTQDTSSPEPLKGAKRRKLRGRH